MRRLVAIAFLLAVSASGARADLANPSTLVIQESEPSRFTVELTLPVVNGRVVKARPVLPDTCVVHGEPEVRGDALKAIRTWTMTCDPTKLVGAPVGVHGLLGTTVDVQLTVEMLDGRRHVDQLRATRAFFVIPEPPGFVKLAREAGRRGVERALRPELALLLLALLLAGARRRELLVALAAFAVAQGLGQWLAGERLIVMSIFIPQAAAAGSAWLVGVERVGRPVLADGWWRPTWVPWILLGMLFGAARPETVPTSGLSTGEQGLSLLLFAAGSLAGLLLLALWADLLRLVLAGRVAHVAVVLAGGFFFYRVSAPLWGGAPAPAVPAVTLVAAAALGLWCRRERRICGLVAAAFFGIGVVVSFHGTLLLAPSIAYGLLALVGARILVAKPWPLSLTLPVVALTALYHGFHAGRILRQDATLPVAHALGMALLLLAVYLLFRRAVPVDAGGLNLAVPGALALLLALLWQLAEHRAWVGGPFASDLAMGTARLPLLAMLLLLGAWLAWPRKRRFASSADTPRTHWALLGLAFFLVPLGTLRVDIPFHTPDAPSAAEARRVMATLLADTYLAFNLSEEDAAFDRLARNLSEDLVADVYLDSRRRLRAGTREGAEVTVRDVDVMQVEDAVATDGDAFTYPCQWVVTARVRHLQHIHNRQNVYAGRLTLRIEDDRWKIAGLDLLGEERIVISRSRS